MRSFDRFSALSASVQCRRCSRASLLYCMRLIAGTAETARYCSRTFLHHLSSSCNISPRQALLYGRKPNLNSSALHGEQFRERCSVEQCPIQTELVHQFSALLALHQTFLVLSPCISVAVGRSRNKHCLQLRYLNIYIANKKCTYETSTLF